MNLARVTGTVVASTVYEGLEAVRLVVLQPLDTKLSAKGSTIVAADAVQSGPGDVVYYVNSREASMGLENSFVPVDACVVGHVDSVGDRNAVGAYDDRGEG